MGKTLLLLFVLGAVLPAQEITGSIVGTVSDKSGAAIPGASVTILDRNRNLTLRGIETDSAGGYVATLLPIGRYSLKVEKAGFTSAVREGIELHAGDKLTFDLELRVGEMAHQITVEASPTAVDLQSAMSAGVINGTEVTELSLNNRNYLQLIALMPGVTSDALGDELYIGTTTPSGTTNTLSYSVNGGRTSGNNFTIDGGDNVDRGSNLTLLNYPSVDSVAEVKVSRGLYSAESGRASTGQVSVMTKSGGSKYHGTVYEFFKNDVLAANYFFNNARNIPRPPLRYNNFGYTFGGPIPFLKGKAGKTFFFWSQEFRRVITYTTFQSVVPSENMKRGIFSAPVCVEFSGNTCTATDTRITNINPIAAAYIKDIWSKIPEGDAAYQLFTPERNTYNHRQDLIKIDHTFSTHHSASVRFLNDTIPTVEPGGLFTGSPLPGVATTRTNAPGQNWTARLTSSFSSSLLNEAGWTYSYGAILSDPIGLDSTSLSPDIHVSLPFPSTLSRIPGVSISNLSSITGRGPYRDYNRNQTIFDTVTKVRRAHTLKAGASYNMYQKTENSGTSNSGTFTFPNTPRPTGTGSVEQAWAYFLLGDASQFTQASLDLTPDMRVKQFETFFQDDFRAAKNLTLNLGVRYSIYRQPFDANHMLTNFDPALYDPAKAPAINPANGNIVPGTGDPLNGIIAGGKNSPYGDKVSGEAYKNIAPRFGLAWDPFKKGKTSVRTGYAISYDSTLVGIYEQNIFGNPPYVNSITINNTRFEAPSTGVTTVSSAPKSLHATPLPAATPYTQQWSFGIQQQIGHRSLLDVSYAGSKSTHLLGIVDINSVQPGMGVAMGIIKGAATSQTTPLLNQIRPYRGYSAINALENRFDANYNSLQVSLQKQFAGASSLRVAYTFSKSLTDAGTDRSSAPQNVYNFRADYGRSPYDRTQVLTISYIYQLPLARGSKGLTGAIAKGWQLTGTTSYATGLPLRVTSSQGLDWGGLGIIGGSAASPRPDMIANPNTDAPHTIAQWFNTKAYAAVPAGQFRPGNASSTFTVGPGYQRWDVSLFKNAALTEKLKLQIRLETFNLPNHTNFAGISTSFGSTNFGQVTSMRDSRKIQLGAKLIF